MMIYIVFGIATKDKGGNYHPVKMKTLMKFRNEHPFEFDILKPENWRKFLSEYTNPNTGLKLPRKSQFGDPVIYYVYLLGTSRWIMSAYNDTRSFINLFPGTEIIHTAKGDISKGKSVAIHGRLIG